MNHLTKSAATPGPSAVRRVDGPPGGARADAVVDRIRARAYELYQARRGLPGDPLTDWLKAEREVMRAEARRPAPGRMESDRAQAALEAHNEARGNAILHVSDA